jgi:hypothetical protein
LKRADWGCNSWDDATIAERYSGEVGEEYKERLTCKVEGRDFVPGSKPAPSSTTSRSQTPRSQTPQGRNPSSAPAASVPPGGKAKVDDRYFAGLGAANASRPEDLPPSQGGKYAGFGSQPVEAPRREVGLPGLDDLQKDPVAALSKGFGWFTTTVGKTAKSVNEGWVQPTAAKVCPFPYASLIFPLRHSSPLIPPHRLKKTNAPSPQARRNRPSSPSTPDSRRRSARCANRREERSRWLQPLRRRHKRESSGRIQGCAN